MTLPQSALPQRRGPDHARRHGDLRRSRAARPQVEVAVLRGTPVEHPKYKASACSAQASTSRISITAASVSVVPSARHGLRQQALPRASACRRRRPTSSAARRSRSRGSRRSRPSRSAAAARSCSPWTTCSPRDAFLTLPARKEGIIPGAANMRCRARSATASPARRSSTNGGSTATAGGPPDLRRDRRAGQHGCRDRRRGDRSLTSSGVVSAASNRRAFRITQEPLDMFRATSRSMRASRPIATSARR